MADEKGTRSRLSKIDTLWSVVRRSHDPKDSIALSGQQQLLEIYGGAIRGYLLASVRDASLAEDLFQEFALKFVKGDFRNVDPEKGRFRHFVKRVISNLIKQHYRRSKVRQATSLSEAQPSEGTESTSEMESEQLLVASWRRDLLEQTWVSLAEHERDSGVNYNTVLRIRVEQPALSSEEFAEVVSRELDKAISSGAARVALHRAREKFANLLIGKVAESLDFADRDNIEAELIELGLIAYCRETLHSMTPD